MNENSSIDNFSVNLENVFIVSKDGSKTLDIRNNVLSISIVEDIFSPYITCHVGVLDFDQISTKFPLVGQEYLVINFSKDKGTTSEYKQSSYTFLIHTQTESGIGENNKFQGYVLRGVTVERFLDQSLTFSKGYHSSYGEMVRNIFNEYFGSLGKEIRIEPTQGIQKFVVPYASPLQAIDIIRKRCISTSEPYTPYLFFQNRDNYIFSSYNTLFTNALQTERSKIVHYYTNNIAENEDRSPGFTSSIVIGENAINDILSLSILSKYDTLDIVDNDAFSSVSSTFDLTTKSYIRRNYRLSDKRGFFLGNRAPLYTTNFITELENLGSSGPYSISDVVGRYSDGNSQDFLPEAITSMKSYITLAMQEKMILNVYGDNNFKAGDSIFLGVTTFDGKFDPSLTGNHLISTVRHVITLDSQPRYITALECLKGSYFRPVENFDNG